MMRYSFVPSCFYNYFFWLLASLCLSPICGICQSDTIPALYCLGRNAQTNQPILNWSIPSLDSCSGLTNITVFGSSTENGTYENLASLPANSLEYQTSRTDLLYFYLEFTFSSCSSGSNRVLSYTVGFEDPPVELEAIELVNTSARVTWFPYREGAVGISYTIVKQITGDAYEVIVADLAETNYTIVDVNPAESAIYRLFAIDSCGNQSKELPFSFTALESSVDSCRSEVLLTWSKNLLQNNPSYTVQRLDSSNFWLTVGQTTDTSFTLPFDPSEDTLCLRIASSFGSSGIIISATKLPVNSFWRVSFLSISDITFDASGRLKLGWVYDTVGSASGFNVIENNNVVVSPLSSGTGSDSLFLLSPSFLIPTSYVVSAIDSCLSGFSSQEVFSPLLIVQANGSAVDFELPSIISMDFQPVSYEWFVVSASGVDSSLGSNGSHNFSVPRDELASDDMEFQNLCFFAVISGIWSVSDTTYSAVVRSNTVCASSSMAFDLPNVLSINAASPNNSFGLYGLASSAIQSYSLKIFNRSGGLVFSSSDIESFWEPTENVLVGSSETFVYILDIILSDGLPVKRSGTITVIY